MRWDGFTGYPTKSGQILKSIKAEAACQGSNTSRYLSTVYNSNITSVKYWQIYFTIANLTKMMANLMTTYFQIMVFTMASSPEYNNTWGQTTTQFNNMAHCVRKLKLEEAKYANITVSYFRFK